MKSVKGRSGAIRRCLGLRKTEEECGLTSLPDEMVWNCLAYVSRLDLAALSMTSKAHRSLATSHCLWEWRRQIDSIEPSYYVCLHIFRERIPRWFILHPVQRRLKPVPSYAYQSPKSGSSFVVVGWGIFIIGGLVNGQPTSEVALLDCFGHAWYTMPPMKIARASASASRIDGKIYVFGGCKDYVDSSNWAEVYDLHTMTWDFVCVPTRPKNIKQSVLIGRKEIYAVDEDRQTFSFSPSKLFVSCGKTDSKPGERDDWCLMGGFLFSRGAHGNILWCLPHDLDWKQVKGLEELQQLLGTCVISKLSTKYPSTIIIFWNAQPQGADSLDLWSAEISLRKLQQRPEIGGKIEIRGKIEWSGSVYKLNYPLTGSNRVKVVYAGFALT